MKLEYLPQKVVCICDKTTRQMSSEVEVVNFKKAYLMRMHPQPYVYPNSTLIILLLRVLGAPITSFSCLRTLGTTTQRLP